MTIEEYNTCVDNFSDGIYRFILKNAKDTDKAKDIVQDTFEKLWNKVLDVDFSKAKSYLFTTAYHTFIDQVRREKKQGDWEEAPLQSLTHTKQYSDLKHILEDALNKLPDIQKSVLMLRDYEGYNYQEIGEITSLTEAQVKVYIFRARTFLKNYIGSIENVL
ncbi:MAG: RNA polymerase sigma factor [Bacteroidetes bacterium]|nr:RNA polymerase sigma factor [Bacteroidota bacterium]